MATKKNNIGVESISFTHDERGNITGTSLSNMSGTLFDVGVMDIQNPETGEYEKIQAMIPTRAKTVSYSFKAPEDEAHIRIASLTPVEGSVLKFKAQDSAHQSCPNLLSVGEFTILKEYDMRLEFSDKPITFADTGIPQDIPYGNKEYPPYPPNKYKTQKQLLFYLLNHRGFYSEFIWHKLEHPPEIQKSLDIKSLMEKKKQILDEQDKLNRQYQTQLKGIEKELRQVGFSLKEEKPKEEKISESKN